MTTTTKKRNRSSGVLAWQTAQGRTVYAALIAQGKSLSQFCRECGLHQRLVSALLCGQTAKSNSQANLKIKAALTAAFGAIEWEQK